MSAFSLTYPEDASAVICDVDVAQSAVARGEYVRCKALWDTGAVATVVSNRLVRALGLSAIDQNMATTVQGSYLASIYLLDVLLPNKMLVKSLRVSDGEFDDCDILIGMDLIRLGDMMITNGGAMKFTFRPLEPFDPQQGNKQQRKHNEQTIAPAMNYIDFINREGRALSRPRTARRPSLPNCQINVFHCRSNKIGARRCADGCRRVVSALDSAVGDLVQ